MLVFSPPHRLIVNNQKRIPGERTHLRRAQGHRLRELHRRPAATVMSDFGAEVIKIEPPRMGDPYRRPPPLAASLRRAILIE
jgi:hypothetical protein